MKDTKRESYKQRFTMFEGAQTVFDKDFINESYADFGNGKIVHDSDVLKLMKKHLRLRDRFNLAKIVLGTFYAFDILNGSAEEPEGKWYW